MDVGRCFRDAFEVYKQNLVVLVVAALLVDVLGLLTLLILLGPLAGGLSLLTLRAVRSKEQRADLNDLFRAFSKFLPLFGLFWLTFVPIMLGTVILIVPGLYLMTIWMFSFYLVVDRDEGVFASLGKSQQMVNRAGFGNCLLLTFVEFALHLAPLGIPYVGCIFGWFITPIGWLIVASAYAQLIESQKLPLSDEEVRSSD
ncbi:MAG: hypothetical protein O3C40_01050 [Planctomycetota bacterium]|nr:hypothetical protein [Planctomycetota bacterium]